MSLGPGGHGGSDHLKGGAGRVFLWVFFFFKSFLCVTSIKTQKYGTLHTLAQKRSSIYSSAGTCPPGQPPAGGVGEEVGHVSRERK